MSSLGAAHRVCPGASDEMLASCFRRQNNGPRRGASPDPRPRDCVPESPAKDFAGVRKLRISSWGNYLNYMGRLNGIMGGGSLKEGDKTSERGGSEVTTGAKTGVVRPHAKVSASSL